MKTLNTKSVSAVDCSVRRHVRGQGLTEYAIIVSLVAIAAIWSASFFGDSVKASFVAMGSQLTGGAEYDMNAGTAKSLKKATDSVTTETTLGNYRD